MAIKSELPNTTMRPPGIVMPSSVPELREDTGDADGAFLVALLIVHRRLLCAVVALGPTVFRSADELMHLQPIIIG